jgi:hypothetical protein
MHQLLHAESPKSIQVISARQGDGTLFFNHTQHGGKIAVLEQKMNERI